MGTAGNLLAETDRLALVLLVVRGIQGKDTRPTPAQGRTPGGAGGPARVLHLGSSSRTPYVCDVRVCVRFGPPVCKVWLPEASGYKSVDLEQWFSTGGTRSTRGTLEYCRGGSL